MRLLRSRLYEMEKQKRDSEIANERKRSKNGERGGELESE